MYLLRSWLLVMLFVCILPTLQEILIRSHVGEYIDGLLSEEAHKRPSDTGKVDDLELKMKLPEWFDENKYNQGRRFFWDFCFLFVTNMILGVLALFAVPSILNILVSTRRSNSPFTSYKRYGSTLQHVFAWHEYDLKPGTKAWRSLQTVRTRHFQAGAAAVVKGHGTVSQRDMALTQFAFIGMAILKPDDLAITQLKDGDWEGFNHFWRTLGYMIGMEDRYNMCRKNIDETREVCRILLDKVFTPCLENPPEYFEHTARVMLEGLKTLNGLIEPTSMLFSTRYLYEVPGYVYTEEQRIACQKKLKEHLKGKSIDVGVDTSVLISKSAIKGLPNRPPRLLYVQDLNSIETTPAYKQLNFAGRYSLALVTIMLGIYKTTVGRVFLNLMYRLSIAINFYFPYKAFLKFGFKNVFVNMFKEDPKDDAEPKLNSEYEKPPPPETWYDTLVSILW